MFRCTFLLPTVLCGSLAFAQDGISPFRPIVGLNVGVGLPKMEVLSGTTFVTRPFFAGTLDFGGSWTYRDKVGVLGMGILAINGYDYAKDVFEYDVYHLTTRLEVRPFWQMPLDPRLSTTLRAGVGVGMAFHGNSVRDSREGPFLASSRAFAAQRTFLSPEVSILRDEGPHRLELGLRYVRHLERAEAFSTTLALGLDTTLATATHDHLALVLRFHFGLKRTPIPILPIPPIDYAERGTDTLATLAASRPRITLWLWDNAEYDGDTLSVLVNGRPVLVGHELGRKRHKMKVDLVPGENVLMVVAHNEGRVSPNTASVVVRTGKGRKELLFTTSLRKNQVLRILREGRM
ncbi:MAG: hypothetical protein WEC15_05005 [Flavobacteriales bacterium]